MSRKTVSFLTVVLLLLIVSMSWIFWKSQSGITQAEKEAIQLVEYDYKVATVNKFYWTTIEIPYFSLDFVDDSGQHRYAIIARQSGEVTYLTPQQVISEDDALAIAAADLTPHRILQARLGLMNNAPVWEVTIKNENNTLTYYYLNASDGKWVQKIENI